MIILLILLLWKVPNPIVSSRSFSMIDCTGIYENAFFELYLTVLGKVIVFMFFVPFTSRDMLLSNSISETKSRASDNSLAQYMTILAGTV